MTIISPRTVTIISPRTVACRFIFTDVLSSQTVDSQISSKPSCLFKVVLAADGWLSAFDWPLFGFIRLRSKPYLN